MKVGDMPIGRGIERVDKIKAISKIVPWGFGAGAVLHGAKSVKSETSLPNRRCVGAEAGVETEAGLGLELGNLTLVLDMCLG
ncbi:hypothetical protein PNOK_0134900 [Pyrrhoderma noxium]|uniref:Uncharacterized protein n=1 Tax=Pyrrhoderma noxium TaxID=2282107 RepID=A0A286UXK1_9AGAM|nr:hypothetical protein PNOK_0134900 [Pyrrhoderma noxium]